MIGRDIEGPAGHKIGAIDRLHQTPFLTVVKCAGGTELVTASNVATIPGHARNGVALALQREQANAAITRAIGCRRKWAETGDGRWQRRATNTHADISVGRSGGIREQAALRLHTVVE